MDIPRTIRELRKKTGLNQQGFAKAMGVTQSAVSHWERGSTAFELAKVPRLAQVTGLSERELMRRLAGDASDEEATVDNSPTSPQLTPYFQGLSDAIARADSLETVIIKAQASISVPLVTLGRVHAGHFSDEELVGYSVEVPASLLEEHPAAEAVVVEGDCMDRVASEGDIVVFDPDLAPTNGRIVIVETKDHGAIIRRWHKGNDTLILYAESHIDYPDIVITGDTPIRVIGTVVKVIVPDSKL